MKNFLLDHLLLSMYVRVHDSHPVIRVNALHCTLQPQLSEHWSQAGSTGQSTKVGHKFNMHMHSMSVVQLPFAIVVLMMSSIAFKKIVLL